MPTSNRVSEFHATAFSSPYLDASIDIICGIIADQLGIDADSVENNANVHWIRPEKTTISRLQISQLLHELTLTVHQGSSRYVVIQQANNLTPEAANALLKTLEEPPENVWFYLSTPSAAQLLPTIRSRVVLRGVIPPTDSLPAIDAEESAKFIDGSVPERFVQISTVQSDDRLPAFTLSLMETLRQRHEYDILEWMQSHHLSKTSPNYRLYLEALATSEVMA